MNPIPTFKTINYSNGTFDIEGQKFPNSFMLTEFPDFAFASNIKQVYYKEASGKNVIIFDDGTKESLTDYEPHYNELILRATGFYIEYKNTQFLKKQEAVQNSLAIISSFTPIDLFRSDITSDEQETIINHVNEARPNYKVDTSFLLKNLKVIKIRLLKESDYTQLPDIQASYSDEEKAAWVEYRSALRSLDDTDNPLEVRLPTPPKDIS